MIKATFLLLAANGVNAADQILEKKQISKFNAISDVYNDVNTELLTIKINENEIDKFQTAGMKLQNAFDDFQPDPAIADKAMQDVMEVAQSPEGQDLMQWFQVNNPFDGSTFGNLDEETQMVFMRAHVQYQVMTQSLIELEMAKKEMGLTLEYDNDKLLAFNKEFTQFIEYKKALLKTSWGKQLHSKVGAVRKTAAFKDLKKQWKNQCETDQGKNMKARFDTFLAEAMIIFMFSDQPDGFKDTAMVQTFVELIGMFEETLEGNPGEVLDWFFGEL